MAPPLAAVGTALQMRRIVSAVAGVGCMVVVIAALLIGSLGVMMVLSGSPEDPDHQDTSATCSDGGAQTSSVEIPSEYEDLVEEAAATSGFSVEMIAAQIDTESSWNPDAYNADSGAAGIAQFIESTWREQGTDDLEDRYDPEIAIPTQGAYMANYYEMWEDQADDDEHLMRLALWSYHAGGGNVPDDLDVTDPALEDEMPRTYQYVQGITAAVEGSYRGNCQNDSGLPTETIGSDGLDGHRQDIGEDDYPFREPIGGDCAYGAPGCGTPWGATQRECTSFVLWRLNQSQGYDSSQADTGVQPPVHFGSMGISYPRTAHYWDSITEHDAFSMADEPQAGDIAWWTREDIDADSGHVGWVNSVDEEEGVVVVEHYNIIYKEYSVSAEPIDEVTGFIRYNQ